MAIERTLCIIKPDAMDQRKQGEILQRLLDEGFEILGLRQLRLTRAVAEGFYAVHRGKPFYDSLCSFMTRGPIIVAAPLGWTKLIAAVVLYAAVGTLQDRIVTPAIMRTELDIPVAGLVIFQLTLAALIGPVGFLLAVPFLAILITLIRELYVYDTLGKRPVTPPPEEEPPDGEEAPDQE